MHLGGGWRLALMLIPLVVLVGCSSPSQPAPPLPELHLAHTTRLPWLDAFIAQDVNHQLGSLSLYAAPVPSPSPTPGRAASTTPSTHQVRLLTTVANETVDVGLDGSNLHTLTLAVPCASDITLTNDGSQAACSTVQGVELFNVGGNASTPISGIILPDASETFGGPSWGPDDSLLLVLHGTLGTLSKVGIYRLPAIGSPQLLLDLRFPGLVADGALWSPDGNWLIVDGSPNGEFFQPYAYSLAPWLPTLRVAMPSAAPLSVSVSNDQLLPLSARADGPYAWRPGHSGQAGQAVVTFVGDGQRAVIERALPSRRETTLFTQHVGFICGLAWTPDGAALVFQLCGPTGDDAPGPPAHLYLYQPPNGT